MDAGELMTSDVVSVFPDAHVSDVASLMAAKHVSGVPVVSKDREILGIVSESDIFRRRELGTENRSRDQPLSPSTSNELARQYAKSHGTTAHDVMSRPVISVLESMDARDVADTLDRHNIKRVPVVRDGKVVGIIARSDLVRAFSKLDGAAGQVNLSNRLVLQTVCEALKNEHWLDSSYINMSARNGIVSLWGYIQSEDHRNAVKLLVEEIPGVKGVENKLQIGMPTLTWEGEIVTP